MLKNKKKISFESIYPRNNEHGFSLVEIAIVGFVIAILLVIALPQSVRQMQLYRLDTGVSAIGGKLMETRMNAIKRNRACWLRLDKTAKNSVIRSTNDAGEIIDVNFTEAFPTGMELDSANSIQVSFDSMGRISGTQTITIKEINSNKKKNITVSPAGKITVGQMY